MDAPRLLWLDDVRPAPPGWEWVRTASACVKALVAVRYAAVHLDHDLGPPRRVGTGMLVLGWMLKEAQAGRYVPPDIRIHTRNGRVRGRMEAAAAAIAKVREHAVCTPRA
jgi:hypothetical protein